VLSGMSGASWSYFSTPDGRFSTSMREDPPPTKLTIGLFLELQGRAGKQGFRHLQDLNKDFAILRFSRGVFWFVRVSIRRLPQPCLLPGCVFFLLKIDPRCSMPFYLRPPLFPDDHRPVGLPTNIPFLTLSSPNLLSLVDLLDPLLMDMCRTFPLLVLFPPAECLTRPICEAYAP